MARDDAASTRVDTAVTIAVLANDTDPEGALVAGLGGHRDGARSGAVTQEVERDGGLHAQPALHRADAFTYTVKDAAGADLQRATVRVTVR